MSQKAAHCQHPLESICLHGPVLAPADAGLRGPDGSPLTRASDPPGTSPEKYFSDFRDLEARALLVRLLLSQA